MEAINHSRWLVLNDYCDQFKKNYTFAKAPGLVGWAAFYLLWLSDTNDFWHDIVYCARRNALELYYE